MYARNTVRQPQSPDVQNGRHKDYARLSDWSDQWPTLYGNTENK